MIALLAALSALGADVPPTTAETTAVSTVPTTTTEAPRMSTGTAVRRSIAATQWPLEPAIGAGFLWSNTAIVPFVGLTTFVPVIPGVGPTVAVRAGATTTGEASYAEAIVGIGVGLEGKLGNLRARASFVPSAQLSVVDVGAGAVTTLGPAVIVPLELGLPLGGGVTFTGSIEPGVAAPVSVVVGDEVVTGRDRFFVMLGAGVTFGGPVD